MSEEKTRRDISRRGFLKTTAAVVGAAAMGGTLAGCGKEGVAASGNNEHFVVNNCRGNCVSVCRLKCKVRDGYLVQTEMQEQVLPVYNRVCSKGLSHPQRTYSDQRVKYPLRRVGERGSDQWERISWEDAISEITTKWKQYQEESGSPSIVFSSATGCLSTSPNVYQHLQSMMGASKTSISYDAAGIEEGIKVVGSGLSMSASWHADMRNAKTILMPGSNAAISMVQSFHFALEAKDAGATLIHIDPNYTITSEKCSVHIPIVPGTDCAMFMGLTNYVIQQGWADESFLKAHTNAPYLVNKATGFFVRAGELYATTEEEASVACVWDAAAGKAVPATSATDTALEGEYTIGDIEAITAYELLKERLSEWTLEKTSEICGIPVEKLEWIADQYVHHGPSCVFTGYGLDHYNGGHMTYRAMFTFTGVCGQWGQSGMGIVGASTSNSSLSNARMVAKDVPQGKNLAVAKLYEIAERGTFNEQPFPIRSMFIWMHNYVPNVADRQRAIRFLNSVDLVVVADFNMCETARYADIVLPVAGWYEIEEVGHGGTAPFVNYLEKAIDPLYESKSDFEIYKLLCEGMGLGDQAFVDLDDFWSGYFESPVMTGLGITLERLKEEKSIYLGTDPDGFDPYAPEGKFNTRDGRMGIYQEAHFRIFGEQDFEVVDPDRNRLVTWMPPNEVMPDNPLREKYPLVYMSFRNRYRTHTQFWDCAWLKEIAPEPTLWLNPDDAAARGIQGGDYVRAYNDRGFVVLRAEINNGVMPGVVVYPKGWQEGEHKAGHISDLTSSYFIPEMYNCYYFDNLCEVEKYQEA